MTEPYVEMKTGTTPFALDLPRVRRQFERAAPTYDAAAVLARTVAERLVERLDVVRMRPTRILDAGCGTGHSTRMVARRYRRAQVVGLDLAWAMAARARRRAGWFARSRFVSGDAGVLPFADTAFDLVSSNLMLPWCEPRTVFAEFLRVLRPGGLLMFTSFGPDTLRELREAWREVDDAPRVHVFLDMHDVGDALVQAGFADPVMDVERYTLTYADTHALLRELQALGAQNAQQGRRRSLTGRARFGRFLDAYACLAQGGRIPASCEVVYGHAWVRQERPAPRGTTVVVPLDKIRRRSV